MDAEHQRRPWLSAPGRQALPGLVAFAVPFAIVLYLGLRGGGYDPVVRGEFGIVVWAIVLAAAAVDAISTARLGRFAWTALALALAFAAWTGVSVIWADSAERAVAELGRVATYVGILVLGVGMGSRASLRRVAEGVAAAVALLGLLALASRLEPGWFPDDEAREFLARASRRLSYPLNYWNGLAALIAIGVPLLLWVATSARHVVTRALAAAVVPALALTVLFTLSRGGVLELAVGIVVLLLFHPHRLSLVPTLVNVGAGSAVLLLAGSAREDIADGLDNATAAAQADELALLVVVVCAVVAVVQAAIAWVATREIGPRPPRLSRAATAAIAGLVVIVVAVGAVAAGAPGELSDGWETFKEPRGPESNATTQRFESASGNGRYQYWSAAIDGADRASIVGIGPGAYEFVWSREGELPGFVRDAHSLYLEVLAELGFVGFVLIGGLVLCVLACGLVLTLRLDDERRTVVAAATAGCAAFAFGAGIDWLWEIPVLPATFLLLGAAVLTAERERPAGARLRDRLPMCAVALVAGAAITIPTLGAAWFEQSRAAVRAGDLDEALNRAEAGRSLQPYAAAPRLQEALVLELQGELDAARDAAAQAVEREPVNWRNWFVLSRLEARTGDADAAIAAYEEARERNPRSLLFSR